MSLHLARRTKYGIAGTLMAVGLAAMVQTPILERFHYLTVGLDPRVERVRQLENELEENVPVRQLICDEQSLINNIYKREERERLESAIRSDMKKYNARADWSYLGFFAGFLAFVVGATLTNVKVKED